MDHINLASFHVEDRIIIVTTWITLTQAMVSLRDTNANYQFTLWLVSTSARK